MKSAKIIKRFKRFIRVSRVKLKWFFKRNLKTRRQRITAGAIAGVLLVVMIAPIYLTLHQSETYQLDASLWNLVGDPAASYTSKLQFDQEKNAYTVNSDAIDSLGADPIEQLQSKVGGGSEDEELLYAATLPRNSAEGVTFYDTQLEVSFKMTPLFNTKVGKKDGGHVVFPLKGYDDAHLIYTLKNNGIKEDIVLSAPIDDVLSFQYELELPESLQAKVLEDGSLGVYSADPTLFGEISYGSDTDRAKVEAARANSEKTHLAFVVPKPVIYETVNGAVTESEKTASYFTYSDNILTVHAKNLNDANYPISIDPSVVVTSTEDFEDGNDEGNIAYDSGLIRRSSVSGGTIGAWNFESNITTAREFHTTAAYNGYLYVAGGSSSGGLLNDIQYASFSGSGLLGAWATTTSFTTARQAHTMIAYNGYMYIIGGDSGSQESSVQSAVINNDGTIGTWTATTSLPTGISGHTSVAQNGYIYVFGGYDTNYRNAVLYATMNADGSLGSWTATTSIATARRYHASATYNGYVYVIGGTNGSNLSSVELAKFNDDGTISSWQSTTSISAARSELAATIYKGYIYVGGGSGSTAMLYASLNATGGISSWSSTTILPSWRQGHTLTAYEDALYLVGGESSGGLQATVHFGQVSPTGVTESFTATTNIPAARRGHAAVAYNGYMYVSGGGTTSTNFNTTVYYAPISSNGTVGAWSTTTAFTTGRRGHGMVAHNGYMYLIGGQSGAATYRSDVLRSSINSSSGALGSWSTMSALPNTLGYFGSAVYGSKIYLVGGLLSGSTRTPLVHSVTINSNGSLATWGTETNQMSIGKERTATVVNGGYIYSIGGYSSSNSYLNTVEYAPIASDGTVGTWASTTTFSTARQAMSAAVHNGYLYISGGDNGSSYFVHVYFAQINDDGTVGSWSTSSPNSPNSRSEHVMLAYNSYLYIIGGYDGSAANYWNLVHYARINSGGSGSADSYASTTALPQATRRHTTVAHNGFIYVIGGEGSSTPYSTVYYAAIGPDGTLGSWTATSSLPLNKAAHVSVLYNGYIYAIGGLSDPGGYTTNVYYTEINSDGTLDTWSSTTSLPGGRYGASGAVYDGYVYFGGGWTGSVNSNVLYYAAINSDGTLGSWNTTTNLPAGVSGHQLIAYKGYLYFTGSDNYFYYAAINGDGTIAASWTRTTGYNTYGQTSRSGHKIATYNGYMYITGGKAGCCFWYNDVQYAQINENGSLGEWQPSTSYSIIRNDHSATFYDGHLYIIGGDSENTPQTSAVFTTIRSANRKSTYSKLIDLGAARTVANLVFIGASAGRYDLEYKIACTDTFGSLTSVMGAQSGNSYEINQPARYVWVRITLDDNEQVALPDTSGSTITSIEVTYESGSVDPELRLRQGSFFEGGVKQGFDTSAGSSEGGGGC